MSDNENEPRTSIQAGTPNYVSEPTQAGAPMETDLSIEGVPSMLDQIVERAKAYERWGLVVGVGVQLLVLFGMIMMGAKKALTGAF